MTNCPACDSNKRDQVKVFDVQAPMGPYIKCTHPWHTTVPQAVRQQFFDELAEGIEVIRNRGKRLAEKEEHD